MKLADEALKDTDPSMVHVMFDRGTAKRGGGRIKNRLMRNCAYLERFYRYSEGQISNIQLNPVIAHFKGLVKIMLYNKVYTIANI